MPTLTRTKERRGRPMNYTRQELDLIGAIFRQAVADACGRGVVVDRRATTMAMVVRDAKEFLRDGTRIQFFATLMGADIATLQAQLLGAAGLDDGRE